MSDESIITQQAQSVIVTAKNGMATAGFILGILGFIFGWIPLAGIWIGYILGILAIIFSGIGISHSNRVNVGRGLAVAGLVFGILTIILKSIPVINLL